MLVRTVTRDEFGDWLLGSDAGVAENLRIDRNVGEGWEPASFHLGPDPRPSADNSVAFLDDLTPGEYRMIWMGASCGEPRSDVSGGGIFHEWTITPAVPLPDSPGVVEVTHEELSKTREGWEDSLCRRPIFNEVVHRSEVRLRYDEAFAPWSEVATLSVQLEPRFEHSLVDESVRLPLEWRWTREMLCESDDPARLDALELNRTPQIGEVRVVAEVQGAGRIESTPVPYHGECPRSCTVSPVGGSPGVPLAVLAFAASVVVLRRRATTPR